MRFKVIWFLIIASMLIMFLSSCGNAEDGGEDTPKSGEMTTTEEESEEVIVTLTNNEGENVGSAVLTEVDEGVQIRVDATHLPSGTHGFHIHEKGACEAPDFESAGGHFNPTNAEHGLENPDGPHAGDLPNIEVADDGTIKDDTVADMVTLEKRQDNSLLDGDGSSLVIHSEADDNVSQPAGDAGNRIACGVIQE